MMDFRSATGGDPSGKVIVMRAVKFGAEICALRMPITAARSAAAGALGAGSALAEPEINLWRRS